MTDIDAIRELRAFLLGEGPLDGTEFGERNRTIPGLYWWRREARVRIDALLSAYDAKCEELRGMALLKERMWQSESECVELRHHVARLGAKVSALDASLGTVIAERDAAHREKAAAMGLVEGHALTIAKLEAERDAAVRDAQRLAFFARPENLPWDEINGSDIHVLATEHAEKCGREEANEEDYLNAMREQIDAIFGEKK